MQCIIIIFLAYQKLSKKFWKNPNITVELNSTLQLNLATSKNKNKKYFLCDIHKWNVTHKKMKNLIYYKDVFFYLFNAIKINEKYFKKNNNKTPSHISLKCTNNSSLQALFTLRICKFSYMDCFMDKRSLRGLPLKHSNSSCSG